MSPLSTMTDGSGRWQRLEEVVQAALERPTDERAAFLAEACGADDDLRREAASLVEREARADGFLATPLGELAANAMTYSPSGTLQADESRIVIGSRIGAYEICARLGVGGMGEVYRAHDHTLGRDVAIKVLPAAFSADAERLARFEREARMLASLSHPHIGAIYGLEGSGEVTALVLELIDGETLEARLGRRPLSAPSALTFAVQIAEALDHAHRQGVTHRDLKPANVMLTKAGAKLLDFGLAKWGKGPGGYVNVSGAASGSLKPSGVDSLTEEGVILGTPHYMAPEQLEGQHMDARADVFAFGAVLYEMLTGRKAFDGGSAAAVMAAVLNAEPPPLAAIQPLVPRSLDRVIRKCLVKDPDHRWQSARDLADELRWIAEDVVRPDRTRENRRPFRFGYVGVLMAVATALAAWAGWSLSSSRESSPLRSVTRFAVVPSTLIPIGGFDISPDGAMLVYSGGPPGSERLFMRRLDQFSDLPIAGTEGANAPFFSPDGQWVAFFSGGKLLKVNVQTTAPPILLCDALGTGLLLNGAAWLQDGTIIFARTEKGLQRVSAEGGEPMPLTSLSQTPREFDHHSPSLLPGGEALLFTLHESNGRFDVVAEHLASRERKVLIESAYDATYVPSGHLLFTRNHTLLAVPFDVKRLAVTGPAVTLMEAVAGGSNDGYGGYRLSAGGTLVFRPEPSQDGRTLTWVDRSGAETPLSIAPRAFGSPRVSPDGRRLAFAIAYGGRRDIWTYDIATDGLSRLTRDGDNRTPVWTRDGRRLIYASMGGDGGQLFLQPADGSGAPERLVSGGSLLAPGTSSADGRVFIYVDGHTGPAGSHMLVLPMDGERKRQRLLDGPGQEWQPSLSPDGQWLAFTSGETARNEIYVAAFPGLESRRQVSVEGGREPVWSRDGRELVYRSGMRMIAVPVDTTRGFSAGKPRVLFEGRYVAGGLDVMGLDYDLAPDGRFLMLKPSADEQAPRGLHVVLNWIEELKRRVPKGN